MSCAPIPDAAPVPGPNPRVNLTEIDTKELRRKLSDSFVDLQTLEMKIQLADARNEGRLDGLSSEVIKQIAGMQVSFSDAMAGFVLQVQGIENSLKTEFQRHDREIALVREAGQRNASELQHVKEAVGQIKQVDAKLDDLVRRQASDMYEVRQTHADNMNEIRQTLEQMRQQMQQQELLGKVVSQAARTGWKWVTSSASRKLLVAILSLLMTGGCSLVTLQDLFH